VRGHVGIEGNEGADALANRGAMLPVVEEREWKELEQEVRAGRVARGEDETGGGCSGEAKSRATEPSRGNEASKVLYVYSPALPKVVELTEWFTHFL
jgi:hypothetical protein